MDYQNYQNYTPPTDRRSPLMESVALSLSVFALMSCALITPAIICSALAMILASLSRGGELKMGVKGTVAFYISLGVLIMILLMLTMTLAMCCFLFDGWDNMLKAFENMQNMSFSETFQFINDTMNQKFFKAY